MLQKQLNMVKIPLKSTDTVFSVFSLLQIMKEAHKATFPEAQQAHLL